MSPHGPVGPLFRRLLPIIIVPVGPVRATALASCLALLLASGCSGSNDHRSRSAGTSTTSNPIATTSTTTPSTLSTDGRTEAVAACRTWGSAGAEPDASAIADNAIQVRASEQAASAAAISPARWTGIATAMEDATRLPLTGLTPQQEAQGAGDIATIDAQCHLLGADIP
jgi:hypothetical protein